jgi:hypothetical protein
MARNEATPMRCEDCGDTFVAQFPLSYPLCPPCDAAMLAEWRESMQEGPVYGDEIADPAYGQAFINASGDWKLWDAGEVPNLTALSPLTDFRIDATSGEIQRKTRAVLVPATAAESAWTKIEDTEESAKVECPS